MLFFNRLMGLMAFAALVTGYITIESGPIWYMDIILVVVSIISESVALINRFKGRSKHAS